MRRCFEAATKEVGLACEPATRAGPLLCQKVATIATQQILASSEGKNIYESVKFLKVDVESGYITLQVFYFLCVIFCQMVFYILQAAVLHSIFPRFTVIHLKLQNKIHFFILSCNMSCIFFNSNVK